MARYVLLFLVLLFGSFSAMAQNSPGSMKGKVTDAETKEPLLFATVAIYKAGSETPITGVETDLDGNYSIGNLDPGEYDLQVSYAGYQAQKFTGITVYSGEEVRKNVTLSSGVDLDIGLVITAHEEPLIRQDNTTQGKKITGKDIASLPTKSLSGMVATAPGASSTDDGAGVTIRGSRSNSNIIYIDGIRVNGSLPPQTEVEQLEIMTGGISAAYGDAIGGVISITTKGPSERFSGNFELENSNFLDPYGYLLGYASFSGPIIKKMDEKLGRERSERSILGYRASVQYRERGDRSPAAGGVYKVKDDIHADMVANPVIPSADGSPGTPKQFSLTEDDVELSNVRPNNSDQRIDVNGKLDFRLNDAIDMSFGGAGVYQTANYAHGSRGGGTTRPRTLTNFHNNPIENQLQYRGYGRLRHRIPNGNDSTAIIRNLSYTLQFSIERRQATIMNETHQDRFFDYGYVGSYDWDIDSVQYGNIEDFLNPDFIGDGFGTFAAVNQSIRGYTDGTINPGLAAYNAGFSEIFPGETGDGFYAYNGFALTNLNVPNQGIFGLVNEQYNNYRKNDLNQFQFNVTGGFEFSPRGTDEGTHKIEFGLLYEQRREHSWSLAPRRLWVIGRQLLNRQMNGTAIFVDSTIVNGATQYNYEIFPVDDQQSQFTSEQTFFDKQVRNQFGYGRSDYIYLDELNPSDLSLELFSAEDLINNLGTNEINYYGYDTYGNILDGTTTFADFWTLRDGEGNLTRPVAPNMPIYTAAYIQDKFSYKDIIFRVGVRVDRYDANTQVLRDRYSFFGATTVGEFRNIDPSVQIPGNIEDDFVVYVNSTENRYDPANNSVTAFRDGDDWYNVEGEFQNNVAIDLGAESVNLLLPSDVTATDVKSSDYDFARAFRDAEPQVAIMPRLAFSFPISDEAGFFAHYDVLTQRAPSNTLTTALNYYRIDDIVQANGNLNNPELRPERTIDYEVGFQQVLSANSAMKVSLYYKELRDLIQSQFYYNALPQPYFGYGNADFGTVKGLSLEYDLRRTGNIRMVANYTLQFADGTSSSAGAQRSTVITLGNLRTTTPLSFDERHRLTLTLDYRYASGKLYNGPEINGKQIFARTGVNLLMIAASGRPYTPAQFITGQYATAGFDGSFNGARLPWNTRMDLRIDKDFQLRAAQTGENAKAPLFVNVYFRVQNLLDTRNLTGVYRFSQSPFDTGYLTSPIGIANVNQIASAEDRALFEQTYQWSLVNPGFFTLPRRMFVGAIFSF